MSREIEFLPILGPQFARIKLDPALVDYLNMNLSNCIEDHSQKLVGRVSEEIKFSAEVASYVLEYLKDYFVAYHLNMVESDRGREMSVLLQAGWYVRQLRNEYNPLHVHTNCAISCVGYLSLPDDIESEWENDSKNDPCNGQIEFAYGTAAMTYNRATKRIKPAIGDFYIFPAGLWHTVYPFNSNGERRSFSMNISIESKPNSRTS